MGIFFPLFFPLFFLFCHILFIWHNTSFRLTIDFHLDDTVTPPYCPQGTAMNVRQPFRAGSFYEADPDLCRRQAVEMLARAEVPDDLPQPLYGGLVPHAGWAFSGPLAALTVRALCADGGPQTFVLLGADHVGGVNEAEVYDAGAWLTPLGEAQIDEQLAAAMIAACPHMRANRRAHDYEHSIEVQVPLLQAACPQAKILPVTVPPQSSAVEIGRCVGEVVAGWPAATAVTILGSTDLTHHGGHFGSPHGSGAAGERWSRANDRRMLDLIEAMAAEKIIPESQQWRNACGAGAIAATISACSRLGARSARVLAYTNSYEISRAARANYADDTTVGYASVVFA